MTLNLRFAVISDLHIAQPHTIWQHPNRLHLVEVSIPVFETILERLSHLDLDCLLLPGDLTQHGEPDNHAWLADRLANLPYPAYVIPGNHDIPVMNADQRSIGFNEFPSYYRANGYQGRDQLYYTCTLAPGVRLVALNSNQFDGQGQQIGWLDDGQLAWLEQVLAQYGDEFLIVMIHHNVVEHLPNQAQDPLGQRYMLGNAALLRSLLLRFGVQVVLTGHLHVQDVAHQEGLYDITTGSLVTYPHPYRILHLQTDGHGCPWLQIESATVQAVPGWDDLQQTSRELMGDRSAMFMVKLLTQPPLNLPLQQAIQLAPQLRYFWADIAAGDALIHLPDLPQAVTQFFYRFSAIATDRSIQMIDNHISLRLERP